MKNYPQNTSNFKKVFIQTYGCQMNEYDTEKMFEVLRHENYFHTDSQDDADLIILNTCSIREKAEHKVYSELGRMRNLKKSNPELKIGVGGCVAQQVGDSILKGDSNVDFVFGTDNLFELPLMLRKIQNGEKIINIQRHDREKVRNFVPEYTFKNLKHSGIKAHLTITKGCNNYCSFCVVPSTRGLEVSREADQIIAEAKRLVSNGTKEICLLGQNVNSYKANGVDFVELLQRLDKIDGLQRLRFTSPHPKDFNEKLADAIFSLSTICEQLHLPLQSGSDQILRMMRRWYKMDTFYQKVSMLRERIPQATLSTDIIVGFPGETDEDFELTLEAIQKIRFDLIYSFKYSPRPGTRAANYSGHLSENVKSERLKILLEMQRKIVQEKFKALVGSDQEVLIEGNHYRKTNIVTGRTRGNHTVFINNSNTKAGDIIRVLITKANQNSLEAVQSSANRYSFK